MSRFEPSDFGQSSVRLHPSLAQYVLYLVFGRYIQTQFLTLVLISTRTLYYVSSTSYRISALLLGRGYLEYYRYQSLYIKFTVSIVQYKKAFFIYNSIVQYSINTQPSSAKGILILLSLKRKDIDEVESKYELFILSTGFLYIVQYNII